MTLRLVAELPQTPPDTKRPTGTVRLMHGTARQYGANISYLDDHVRWMIRAGRAERTIRTRRQHLQYVADFLHADPFHATEHDLETWQDSLPQNQLRYKTAVIRPYYHWVHAKGYRTDNPAALLVTPPARPGLPRPIGTDDLFRALDLAPDRIEPWLLLAGWCGLRAKEIAGLTADAFMHHDGHWFMHLTVTKGGYPRIVPIPAWMWPRLEPYIPQHGPLWRRERGTGPVTAQHVSQYCNDHLHKCGVRSTLHALRHWYATEASEESTDLRAVQELLGHRDAATTAIYTQVRPHRLAHIADRLPRPPERVERLRIVS